tara:strand:- start:142 stop:519 length:378 start_codon:yes stop_codon:yes gene_type:complete
MNKLLLLCLSLTLFSCTAFEKQFIDVDDTLVVKGGQTKKEILDVLGKPTAVKEGIVMEEGDVFEIWRYVTKEGKNEVQSLLLPRKPPKQMDFEDWDKSDDFYVMFKNNLVIRWGDLTIDWKDPNA